jgi:hypothetical protein
LPSCRAVIEKALSCNAVAAPRLERNFFKSAYNAAFVHRIKYPLNGDKITLDNDGNWRVRHHLLESRKGFALMRHEMFASNAGRRQVLLHAGVFMIKVSNGFHVIAFYDRSYECFNA